MILQSVRCYLAFSLSYRDKTQNIRYVDAEFIKHISTADGRLRGHGPKALRGAGSARWSQGGNRITSCYYCNTAKRNFDPAKGQFKIKKIPDKHTQNRLIQVSIEYIKQKKEKVWAYGGGPVSSFNFMMEKMQHK